MKLKKNQNGPLLLMVLGLFIFWYSCSNQSSDADNPEINYSTEQSTVKTANITEIAVEAPPLTDGIFPCNDCHSEIEPNPDRRELVDMHDDITAMFNHDSKNRWCLDCHDLNNRDSLRLASGQLLDFKESYKLCGQCHGLKLRDWKVGVHGKRTGEWNGKKEYLLCVHCHNPHAPKFEPLTPEPPPVMQESISYMNLKVNDDETE
ncbi:cytochrome c3 family protein [Draconibacterium sp. IB214405]|uniref:cytochrome c3 family protein n=1 Tax=Draconibacterium sp. IB214405 TaxID=3097352 RepID=UPI002A0EF07B|nr:cytochrome c3 family protein [Draconibacterium sp. IB214405]MDX8338219.1 cytochrome c3 family protein [Draconibacterium sp. IB214405]